MSALDDAKAALDTAIATGEQKFHDTPNKSNASILLMNAAGCVAVLSFNHHGLHVSIHGGEPIRISEASLHVKMAAAKAMPILLLAMTTPEADPTVDDVTAATTTLTNWISSGTVPGLIDSQPS